MQLGQKSSRAAVEPPHPFEQSFEAHIPLWWAPADSTVLPPQRDSYGCSSGGSIHSGAPGRSVSVTRSWQLKKTYYTRHGASSSRAYTSVQSMVTFHRSFVWGFFKEVSGQFVLNWPRWEKAQRRSTLPVCSLQVWIRALLEVYVLLLRTSSRELRTGQCTDCITLLLSCNIYFTDEMALLFLLCRVRCGPYSLSSCRTVTCQSLIYIFPVTVMKYVYLIRCHSWHHESKVQILLEIKEWVNKNWW